MKNLTIELTGKAKEEYIKNRFPKQKQYEPIIIKDSIREELMEHINDFNKEEQNCFTMFHEDCYIIGYYKAEQWLKKHDLNTFEAIEICHNYEHQNLGEGKKTTFDNAEKLVNHLVYWFGLDLCSELEIPMD